MTQEAPLEPTPTGLGPAEDGWFTLNVADANWVASERFGGACDVEGGERLFAQVGYTLCVLQPGQPSALYHAESDQEDFLVLCGECLLLVEGQERRLRAGDFVHCPPGTAHIFVGAGAGVSVIFMIGARSAGASIVYPRSELALRHGAGVEVETASPAEAYAPFPKWLPGRPDGVAEPPWA
jgi:uncharacterized cupin superfamily protein